MYSCHCINLMLLRSCGVLYTHTQEVRMKRFRQSLEQVVGDLYSALDSLDVPLRTLLLSHIDYLHRYITLLPYTEVQQTIKFVKLLHQMSHLAN